MAEASKSEKKAPHPARFVVWGIIGLVVLIIVGSALSRLLSDDKEEVAATATATAPKAESMTVEASFACDLSDDVWNKYGGWCQKKLAPGTYSLKLTRWDYQMAERAILGGPITQHERVPEHGFALSRFTQESYRAQFLAEAPRGDLQLVAAPLYRVNGTGAAPVKAARFTLKEEGVVEFGINMIPGQSYYEGGKGGMTVEISRVDG